MKDIKTLAVDNKFNTLNALEGNKFWYKFKSESFEVIINAQKDISIASADYTQNSIDAVTISKSNKKQYVLKEYNNQPLFTLIPVINYSDYTEKPNATYIENEGFKKCKDDGKCYVGLFNTKVASIMNDTNIDNKAKELSIYMEKIYRIKPSMVQKVGILTHTENLGIYMKAKKILPQQIQDDIKNRSLKMMEDYNKYINSKEVRDKVKENGGGYIKN